MNLRPELACLMNESGVMLKAVPDRLFTADARGKRWDGVIDGRRRADALTWLLFSAHRIIINAPLAPDRMSQLSACCLPLFTRMKSKSSSSGSRVV